MRSPLTVFRQSVLHAVCLPPIHSVLLGFWCVRVKEIPDRVHLGVDNRQLTLSAPVLLGLRRSLTRACTDLPTCKTPPGTALKFPHYSHQLMQ